MHRLDEEDCAVMEESSDFIYLLQKGVLTQFLSFSINKKMKPDSFVVQDLDIGRGYDQDYPEVLKVKVIDPPALFAGP